MDILKPLRDRVLIRRDVEKVSEGGIVLPETSRDRMQMFYGTVEAVGPGRYENGVLIPMNVKVGDRVLWEGFGGRGGLKYKGHDYTLIPEIDLSGILEEGKAEERDGG